MKIQQVFEALADENRRKILELLKRKDMAVNEIGEHLPITGASLSHHLNKLKAADLVIAKRNGQTIIYSIHTSVFEDVAGLAAKFFEVGGKNKKFDQIKDLSNAYLVMDDIEVGINNKIPLWLFGFLY